MNAIYETRGRAKEYCPLAVNLYTGCSHGCVYCYSPDVTHRDREKFKTDPQPRKGIMVQLIKDAKLLAKLNKQADRGPVLLCFTCDPYQPLEETTMFTRNAIWLLHEYGIRVTILTKAGLLAQRDFDLYKPGDSFGTTLTCLDSAQSQVWEPGAALPAERIANLWAAHEKKGISTWVSCEPVIYPETTLDLIRATHRFVDMFKVGKMNYIERLPPEFQHQVEGILWHNFARDVVRLLNELGAKYYIKRDLAQWL